MDKTHLTADALCDFAEGLMAPADRLNAETHLAGCAECRREVAAMQGYFREMSGLETLKAPDRFLTKVHARIAKASPWRRLLAALSSPRLLPAPFMGLAVILVGVYFAFLSPRLAEEVPAESVAMPATPAPETTVRIAKKQEQPAEPAAEAPQAGASADAADAPPAQVAMAPAKPRSPAAPAPEAEERIATLSKASRSNRAAGRAAPARPKADIAAGESAPVETETLAMNQAGEPAKKGIREEQAEGRGAGGAAGNKEKKLAEETVGWLDNPSAVYILDNSGPGDEVMGQIANSGGLADRVKDGPEGQPKPAAPPAPAPAAKAEAAPADKAAAPVAAAPVAVAAAKNPATPVKPSPGAAPKSEADTKAKAKASESKSVGRISEPVALAESPARDDRDIVQFESDDEAGYSAPRGSSRKRSAPAAAAPPAATPKPWAPLGYTLKAKVGEAALRSGLARLGVKVLRNDDASGRRYELEVPATKVIDLETYLGGLGALTPSPQPLPGRKNGAPILLTLKVIAP